MKKFILLALLLLQSACSQENASVQTNDSKPTKTAAASEPCENPLPDGDAEIPKENAKRLVNACVDSLFQRVAQACAAQDGAMLLAQITPKYQALILSRKPESISVFAHVAYICGDMARIRKEMLSISAEPAYGIFRSRQSARLCVYKQNQSRCEGKLKVAFADGKLKLNTH
ncbi:MAG: hypothetical protein LBF51_04415 [Zoogloeaceae bacterium]|jgi:hypothetical protein|nr:hypothetical protein [Zoogloeaceae bacterium]